MSVADEEDKYGEWITVDYYDGPLEEIALVTLRGGDRMVEVKTIGGWDAEETFTIGRDEHVRYRHIRFSRENLVAMLDLIDGKEVKGFFDE